MSKPPLDWKDPKPGIGHLKKEAETKTVRYAIYDIGSGAFNAVAEVKAAQGGTTNSLVTERVRSLPEAQTACQEHWDKQP